MHDHFSEVRPIRIGSLFSGYGDLDLAVEYATGGETVWFSEINEPVARVFAHHWPGHPEPRRHLHRRLGHRSAG